MHKNPLAAGNHDMLSAFLTWPYMLLCFSFPPPLCIFLHLQSLQCGHISWSWKCTVANSIPGHIFVYCSSVQHILLSCVGLCVCVTQVNKNIVANMFKRTGCKNCYLDKMKTKMEKFEFSLVYGSHHCDKTPSTGKIKLWKKFCHGKITYCLKAFEIFVWKLSTAKKWRNNGPFTTGKKAKYPGYGLCASGNSKLWKTAIQ